MDLQGLLFFPVTPFANDGSVDVDLLARHVADGVAAGAASVFAACGTGEFHALTVAEVIEVGTVAVEAAAGRVPVLVGTGGSVAAAIETARGLGRAGAEGLLLLPPYLILASERGLVDYVSQIAASSPIPVIVYQRSGMIFSPDVVVELAKLPNVIGLKDGVGDLTRMQATVSAVRAAGFDSFMFFNGLPTAEVSMRAYRAVGVPLYSSAVFAFAPDIALAFYRAFAADDDETLEWLLREFFIPFTRIRDRQLGYHVSLVKAAASVDGRPLGPVRAPLTAPLAADLDDLRNLLATARTALEERSLVAGDATGAHA
ncbi:5-dehydro-4-deoxyglucarate dehydratase [Subtercola boreus]|uniref:Probable 5-dehydro-4-deoxyglucarate dehydratase n=1 Tax=Subtercola boreus TaxID=120213 RepID=A0A3E0WBW7_9MICO|nr:5-dehydro-4-deoxyglucarate dehydratase [Subtercola boreus]RFA22058.1 5-dehydro-4-deoxyglucarate dehydratase [Subtercola boreus]RFA22238.1 5-dehydro-4-deoxyglucarate dehydratase [Subtercola boreus]RFA28101.1 5-dehydro-4-deoxyglucarate dehydratase [Subtercola boreus]